MADHKNYGQCPTCKKVYTSGTDRRTHKLTSGHGG